MSGQIIQGRATPVWSALSIPGYGTTAIGADPGIVSRAGFSLFVLLTAVLFIRPAEVIPALHGVHLYEGIILACCLVSGTAVVRQLTALMVTSQPITLCVLGLLGAVVLSHLSHLHTWEARTSGVNFFRVVVYYLLLIANVNSLSRVRLFFAWLVLSVSVLTLLALLQYHGAIDLDALKVLEERSVNRETDDISIITRLRSTGIYNDPNDLSLILVTGMALCAYLLTERRLSPLRIVWIAPIGLFGYALTLTQSRGGFLAFVAGLLLLWRSRLGWMKTALLAACGLPILFLLFAGRQTNIDLSNTEDTSQSRVQLWSEGLELFREAPLFGIGHGEYAGRVSQVAHNSFLHCFSELGVVGGMLFLGAFYSAVLSLRRCGTAWTDKDSELPRLRSYYLALLTAYMVGMMSLSRAYVEPTFMFLGLACVLSNFNTTDQKAPRVKLDGKWLAHLAVVSVAFLFIMYWFVRLFAHWGGSPN